jgi:hypothetical protein
MAQRPSILPAWATQNPAGVAQPTQSQTETGWVPGQAPAAENANWLQQQNAAWLAYLDENTTTTALFTDLAISSRLVSQAIWSWKLGTRTLAWDNSLYISYPGAADAANAIAAGSVALSPGDCAYVQANAPFTTIGSTTSGSKTVTSVLYADQIQVGWVVSGAGIPSGTSVASIGSDGSSVILSNAATATATNQQFSFGGSGNLTVLTTPMSSLTPASGTVILARATDTTCYVGIGSGQMRLHDGEKKGLLEGGYLDVRRMLAGQALSALQFVYVVGNSGDGGRTVGSVFPADASSVNRYASIGVNVTAHASGETAQIVSAGFVDGFSGLVTGQPYYLDPANPGAIQLGKPVIAPNYVVPIGTAISQTAMILNPNAAADAQQISNDFSISGAISANRIASAQGFRQQVYMGGISGSGTSTPSGYCATSTGVRTFNPGFAGSLLNVQFSGTLNLSGNWNVVVYIDRGAQTVGSGTQLLSSSNAFFTSGNHSAMYFPQTKGKLTFGAFDIITVYLAAASQQSTSTIYIHCDLTVEMAA